jgi:hypothetical protein
MKPESASWPLVELEGLRGHPEILLSGDVELIRQEHEALDHAAGLSAAGLKRRARPTRISFLYGLPCAASIGPPREETLK